MIWFKQQLNWEIWQYCKRYTNSFNTNGKYEFNEYHKKEKMLDNYEKNIRKALNSKLHSRKNVGQMWQCTLSKLWNEFGYKL